MTTKKNAKSESARSEVRIAISDQAREITVEVALERDEVLSLIKKSIASNEPLLLSDVRGRNYLIPSAKISSVEVGDSAERRVGFAGL
ncbi:MAG: DUF3107 domain-containing protein [Actinobacteria bacterium]|jgi:hypothetical protein|nr:DUF3107 domain-containing protein [Actinomycetota bacterium]